jgi:predicted regulator of Ras-like GTPase activity (Roadblock/LC7/MglB family)
MATIRQVLDALVRRQGVQAVVAVGEDGLPIDSRMGDGIDPEGLAALVPAIVRACDEFGGASRRGPFAGGVFEFGDGLALVTVLGGGALLAILVAPQTDVGELLYDLKRYHPAITALF